MFDRTLWGRSRDVEKNCHIAITWYWNYLIITCCRLTLLSNNHVTPHLGQLRGNNHCLLIFTTITLVKQLHIYRQIRNIFFLQTRYRYFGSLYRPLRDRVRFRELRRLAPFDRFVNIWGLSSQGKLKILQKNTEKLLLNSNLNVAHLGSNLGMGWPKADTGKSSLISRYLTSSTFGHKLFGESWSGSHFVPAAIRSCLCFNFSITLCSRIRWTSHLKV